MTATISPQAVTALTLTRRAAAREYQLTDEDGRGGACLRVGWPVRRGEIAIDGQSWPVRRHLRGEISAGSQDQPLVRLSRAASLVPGSEPRASWAITRYRGGYQGTLTRGRDTIVLRLAALTGRRFAIELTGDWERRDLVLLTGCFALLARCRKDLAVMIAVSGSHGS